MTFLPCRLTIREKAEPLGTRPPGSTARRPAGLMASAGPSDVPPTNRQPEPAAELQGGTTRQMPGRRRHHFGQHTIAELPELLNPGRTAKCIRISGW